MTFTEKHLTTPPPIVLEGRHLKRYHVAMDESGIDADVEAAALAYLPSLLPEVDDETPPAGFVVLHRGADGAAYLNAYSWVWGNVISCATAAAGQPVVDCPDDDPTHFATLTKPWIGCIWELPALGHERSAWVQHIIMPEQPDLDAYLSDQLPEGRTGGPEQTCRR
jgi:hypothetical protein